MVVRVLVVDDSSFFRRRVTEMLESDPRIKVIGAAENGSEAVQKASRLKPDVITMDIEMPMMDGITATKRILAVQRASILMFSSLTTEGAQATLDALEAGAVDFLPKRFEDISTDKETAKRQLCEKVIVIARQASNRLGYHSTAGNLTQTKLGTRPAIPTQPRISPGVAHQRTPSNQVNTKKGQFKLILIGTSTGGPIALQKVLSQVPKDFAAPIVLVQHMPGSFTTAFAQRLNSMCAIEVREARDGDELKPGLALLAPGGKQMEVERRVGKMFVRIKEAQTGENYKPCVDITFRSAVKIEPLKTLAIILTGMGADGCEGCKALKGGGATVWAQNEQTCVVYGMPAAVVEAGIADSVLAIDEIGTNLAQRA
ncbi:MAG: chemotaxis protein CheY [Gammaproteobacteria bacterium SG8_11]|nr:MAG: chemotaxis protein CheY [Gammaproteobacteria bacterium SG8_11]